MHGWITYCMYNKSVVRLFPLTECYNSVTQPWEPHATARAQIRVRNKKRFNELLSNVKVKNNQCMNLNVERKGYVIPTLRCAMWKCSIVSLCNNFVIVSNLHLGPCGAVHWHPKGYISNLFAWTPPSPPGNVTWASRPLPPLMVWDVTFGVVKRSLSNGLNHHGTIGD